MSRPLYSTAFISEALTPGGVSEYAVPEGRTAVIRDISGTFYTGLTGPGVLSVDAGVPEVYLFWCPDQDQEVFHWEGRVVLPGPSFISASIVGGASSLCYVTVSGYLLNGVSP